jgi:hypothetical protein
MRYKIRKGTIIGQDFSWFQWSSNDVVFSASERKT